MFCGRDLLLQDLPLRPALPVGSAEAPPRLARPAPQVKLAKRLVESSFADRCFYANTGTEVRDACWRWCRLWWCY